MENISTQSILPVGGWKSLKVRVIGKPAVVASGSRLDLFYQAPDMRIYRKYRTNGTWDSSAPQPVSDAAVAGFSVVSRGPGRFDVFARSPTDNRIRHYWKAASDAPGEKFRAEPLPGGGVADSQPCAITWGPSRLDVFARFNDGNVYHTHKEGSADWQSWSNVGGTILGLPCPVSWGPGRIDLAVCGTDHAIYHKSKDGDGGAWQPSQTGWGRITDVGVTAPSSSPVEVSWGQGRLDLFIHGANALRAVYHKAHVPGQGWEPSVTALEAAALGGQFAVDTLHVVAPSADRLDIVALADSGDVHHKAWNGSAWAPAGGPFASLGQPDAGPIRGPPVLSPRGSQELMVFAAGPGGELWCWSQGSL